MGCIPAKERSVISTQLKIEESAIRSSMTKGIKNSSRILLYKQSYICNVVVINVKETDGQSYNNLIDKQLYELTKLKELNCSPCRN